jgi:predicted alpha/beta superfamily hydrolase
VAFGQRRRLFRASFALLVVALMAYAGVLAWIWITRVDLSVESPALSVRRTVTVFGPSAAKQELVIYSLDGNKHRNGLLLAAHAAIFAIVKGKPRPLLVAVHDQGARDRDFRPPVVSPASWRPNISGRAPAFDVFLIDELRAQIERRFGVPQQRWLFGHSLAGYYALDMPTRRSSHGFAAIHAFSPTFSHDLSLLNRINATCRATPHIYANIGLESARDSDVFGQAEQAFRVAPGCRGKVSLSQHYGIVHQLIMLTGHAEVFIVLGT